MLSQVKDLMLVKENSFPMLMSIDVNSDKFAQVINVLVKSLKVDENIVKQVIMNTVD